MSDRPTSSDTRSATSSPASESGVLQHVQWAGQTTVHFGLDLVRANLSPRQEKESGLLTTAISGPRSTISSASSTLQSSLVSKLQALTGCVGSRVYKLTWKTRALPSGRSIPALRASPMNKATKDSTSGSDYTGWGTSNTVDHLPGGRNMEYRKSIGGCSNLKDQVTLVGWATPKASDGTGGRTSETLGGGNVHLDKQARLTSGWPTPTAKLAAGGEYKDKDKDKDKALARVLGPHSNDLRDFAQIAEPLIGAPAETGSTGRLRAGHSRWLMRIPSVWDDCVPTETPSTLRKRKGSSKPFLPVSPDDCSDIC